MAKKNKEDDWSPEFNQALSKATDHYTEMKKLEPVSLEQKLKIENAKEQLDHLKKIDGDWQNLEFLVDLVVYKKSDGKLKACLIYPGAEQKTMGDYADAYEWCKLSEETQEMVTYFKIWRKRIIIDQNLAEL